MDFYISEDTRKLIKAKRQIVRSARKTKDPEHKALALKLKTEIKKCIKIDKEEDLDRYTTGLDGEKDPKKFWQGFNKIRGGKAQAIIQLLRKIVNHLKMTKKRLMHLQKPWEKSTIPTKDLSLMTILKK